MLPLTDFGCNSPIQSHLSNHFMPKPLTNLTQYCCIEAKLNLLCYRRLNFVQWLAARNYCAAQNRIISTPIILYIPLSASTTIIITHTFTPTTTTIPFTMMKWSYGKAWGKRLQDFSVKNGNTDIFQKTMLPAHSFSSVFLLI